MAHSTMSYNLPSTSSPPVIIFMPDEGRREDLSNLNRPNPTESTHQSAGNNCMIRRSDENSPTHAVSLPSISTYAETAVTNDDDNIKTLFFHHCSLIFIRFVLLGVLILYSRMYYLVIFCGFHAFIVLIAVTMSNTLMMQDAGIPVKMRSKWREQDVTGTIEGSINDVNYFMFFTLVTLFSVDSHFYMENHTLFYFVIPFIENLILFIYLCCLTWTMKLFLLGFLIVLISLVFCISCTCFCWCHHLSLFTLTDDKTDADEKNQSSSLPQFSLLLIFFQTLLCIDPSSIKSGRKWYRDNRRVRHGHQASISQIKTAVNIDELGATTLDRRHFPTSFEEQVQGATDGENDLNRLFIWSNGLPEIADNCLEKNHEKKNFTNFEATVLMCWCENHQQENLLEIARMLIESSEYPREYVNSKNALAETALHKLCAQYSHENLFSIVKLFVENGADVNAASLKNRTPLLQLCKYYQGDNLIDIVQLLIQKGADVNAADSEGRTPLLELCNNYGKNNMIDIIHLLIKEGANVNAEDSGGKTPLIELCDPCQPQVKINVIQLLMDSGVSNDDDVAIQVEMLLEENQAREKNLSVKFNEVYRAWNESRERSTSYANALQN